ncbi:tetratricopeptide repeat protein [bacterium]|nr:tetratricopeptide repeat protein [bacterium]
MELFEDISKEEAISLFKSGQLDDAIPAFENIALKFPDDPQIHSYLGMAYCKIGEKEKCIASFEKSLLLLKSARAHYNLGIAYDSAGRQSEAKDQFQKALDYDPSYSPAREAIRQIDSQHSNEPPIMARVASEPQPTIMGQAPPTVSAQQSNAIGMVPDFTTLAAPKAPPDLSAEKAQKELEWQERRKTYVKSGLAYGAICGAVLLLLIRLCLVIMASSFLGKGSALLILVGAIIQGGIVGGIVGLWVGLTCGAENEGAVAGAVVGGAYGLLAGLIGGMGGLAILNMLFSALCTGIFGFFIGKMVASSLN